jgi:hypothetical protein
MSNKEQKPEEIIKSNVRSMPISPPMRHFYRIPPAHWASGGSLKPGRVNRILRGGTDGGEHLGMGNYLTCSWVSLRGRRVTGSRP